MSGVLAVADPAGEPEPLARSAGALAHGGQTLHPLDVRLAAVARTATTAWRGAAAAAFGAAAADTGRELDRLAGSHQQAGSALAGHARLLAAAQAEADRAHRAVQDELAAYARRGTLAAHDLADRLRAVSAASPQPLLEVAAARLRAWRPGADLAVVDRTGDPAVPTVEGVRRLLAGGDGLSDLLLTLQAALVGLPPQVADAVRTVELLEETTAVALVTAQRRALVAVGEVQQSARRLAARLEELALGLGAGDTAGLRPLVVDVVLADVADPGARDALRRALAGGSVPALAAALAALPADERRAAVDELLAGDLLAGVRGDLAHAGTDDRLELESVLLAAVSADLRPDLLALLPDLQPSDAGVPDWSVPAEATYLPTGPVTVGTASAADVLQGDVGDCYFLAALVATVTADPGFLARHLRDNGNGTTTVTLYDGSRPVEITVTDDSPAGAGREQLGRGSWPELYEKAFAELQGGYAKLDTGGWGPDGLSPITGQHVPALGDVRGVDLTRLTALLADRRAVVVATSATGNEGPDDLHGTLIGNHMYAVQSVNPDGTVTLRNPWDPDDTPTLTWAQVQAQTQQIAWTDATP